MEHTEGKSNLPHLNRLSLIVATILLAITSSQLALSTTVDTDFAINNYSLLNRSGYLIVILILISALTAAGTDRLIRDHPIYKQGYFYHHLILPTLTSFVIGIPLFQNPLNIIWWLGFCLGGILLILVLVAEYIVVDHEDNLYRASSAGLTALSFALFLTLAIALRFSATRMMIIIPVLAFAAGIISLRAIRLQIHTGWAFAQSIVIALMSGQFAAGLYFWSLSPISYGLALLGPAYCVTSLSVNFLRKEELKKAIIEPVVVLIVILVLAGLLR